jgi:hypothetical protein
VYRERGREKQWEVFGCNKKDKLFFPPPLAFTLYNHTHGREMVDIFVHQLLTFATILAGLVAFIEFLTRSKVTLVLLRSSLIMLQGSWLWQVSWGLQVLYLCLLRIKNKLLFLFGGALCCKSHIPCDVLPALT